MRCLGTLQDFFLVLMPTEEWYLKEEQGGKLLLLQIAAKSLFFPTVFYPASRLELPPRAVLLCMSDTRKERPTFRCCTLGVPLSHHLSQPSATPTKGASRSLEYLIHQTSLAVFATTTILLLSSAMSFAKFAKSLPPSLSLAGRTALITGSSPVSEDRSLFTWLVPVPKCSAQIW